VNIVSFVENSAILTVQYLLYPPSNSLEHTIVSMTLHNSIEPLITP